MVVPASTNTCEEKPTGASMDSDTPENRETRRFSLKRGRRKLQQGNNQQPPGRTPSRFRQTIQGALLKRKKNVDGAKQLPQWKKESGLQEVENTMTNTGLDEPLSEAVRVVALAEVREANKSPEKDDSPFVQSDTVSQSVGSPSTRNESVTAILRHSYLEQLEFACGTLDPTCACFSSQHQLEHRVLPEDPTVQESIECVFASQLEEGLPYLLLEDAEEEDSDNEELLAPSILQQSLLKNRSDTNLRANSRSPKLTKKKVHASLEYVGTMDPSHSDDVEAEEDQSPALSPSTCTCSSRSSPIPDPSTWPQSPLLLRATRQCGMRVIGIRFSSSSDYIWAASSPSMPWPKALRKHWGVSSTTPGKSTVADTVCRDCVILPINNGNEKDGETLVTDFESDLFEGSLMLRLRYSNGTTPSAYDDGIGYFTGMNRRYQAVIRGKFKRAIPLTECVAGFELKRPCGKLPPKWIVKGALRVVGFFAPQMQARLDGQHPSSLSPLGSTPQCLIVHDDGTEYDIAQPHEEPTDASQTLLHQAVESSSSLHRARLRKKAFDRLYSVKSPFPMTDPTKVYTFEFLQHMLNFNNFSIELGSMLGAIQLKEVLDGQPLQIMASHKTTRLWSFDLWHESLVEDAVRHDSL